MSNSTYLLAVAFTLLGLGYIFASTRKNTAVTVVKTINRGRIVISAVFITITVWVFLNSGGFAQLFAFLALILIGAYLALRRDESTDLS